MHLNDKFEENGIPVDVFWVDLPYSFDKRYFVFNPKTFGKKDLDILKDVLDLSNRKMVVITDPHIKYDYSYSVYSEGKEIETAVEDLNN